MTYEDWSADARNATELAELLKNPVLSTALNIVGDFALSKNFGANQILGSADKAAVLFGFDAGRHQAINDLRALSVAKEELTEILPTYDTTY